MEQYDLICIGSGPAGEKAATQARYFGQRAAIIECSSRPGGAMVNTGTIPSKALRETALICSALRRRPVPGVSLSIADHLSVAQLMARRHLVAQQEHDRIEAAIDRYGVDVFRGRGRLVDAHTVEVTADDGSVRQLRSRFVLVATGSSPFHPEGIPFEHPAVVDADGVLDLDRLPRSLVIVGAGVIGCEYASIFAEIGTTVTLVHPRDTVLPFLDEDCRDHLVRSMRHDGVNFRLEDSVDSVSVRSDDTVEVTLEGGDTLVAEALLWAAGRTPNSTNLGLEAIGIERTSRGAIVVDDQYATAVPSVYAAGDVIGFPALASTSMEQGRLAVWNMFKITHERALASTMPIGIYTIPAVSMVGLTEEQARDAGFDPVCGKTEYRLNARGRMLGDETGLLKCVFDRSTRVLLGAAIAGAEATELIHVAVLGVRRQATIDDFIGACFNYPTLSEMYKHAAYIALGIIDADTDDRALAQVA